MKMRVGFRFVGILTLGGYYVCKIRLIRVGILFFETLPALLAAVQSNPVRSLNPVIRQNWTETRTNPEVCIGFRGVVIHHPILRFC